MSDGRMTAKSFKSFYSSGDLVITEFDSIDGAQASGCWIRGKPTRVRQ